MIVEINIGQFFISICHDLSYDFTLDLTVNMQSTQIAGVSQVRHI